MYMRSRFYFLKNIYLSIVLHEFFFLIFLIFLFYNKINFSII